MVPNSGGCRSKLRHDEGGLCTALGALWRRSGLSVGMLGNFEGSTDEKLDQVAGLFSSLAPQASCRLSRDGQVIICEAPRPDGTMHVERLRVDRLPADVVRHAAMRLGVATHPPGSIGEWERWASAWHLLQTHGAGAIAHAEERIASLDADASAAGAEVWRDLRRRVAVLQAKPEAWAGQA